MINRFVFNQKVKIFMVFLLSMSNPINSQSINNSFVGNYVEILNNDSIKIYYNCCGGIVEKRCAEFFRIGKMDSLFCNVTRRFTDYYISGEVAFKGTMKNGKLIGIGTYFFRNGKVSEIGVYYSNIRIGEWKYFYPNGRLMKTFNFVDGDPLVINYYDKDGIERVINGNGYYVGSFCGINECFPFLIKGKIYEGKRDSIWTFSGVNNEIWDKGKFVQGSTYIQDNNKYPMMRLQGFVGTENVSIVETSIGCPGDNHLFFVQYKGESLPQIFYPNLERNIRKALNNKTPDQWIILSILIDNTDKLNRIYVHSSIHDSLVESKIFDLINKSNKCWKSARVNFKEVEAEILIPIIIENKEVQIQTPY